MTRQVNQALSNRSLMPDIVAEYHKSKVHFISTNHLKAQDWILADVVQRHKEMMAGVAAHLCISISIDAYLPRINVDGQLEGTDDCTIV